MDAPDSSLRLGPLAFQQPRLDGLNRRCILWLSYWKRDTVGGQKLPQHHLALEKKSERTPRSDVLLAQARLRMVRLLEQKKKDKRQRSGMTRLNKPTHMTHGSVLDDLGFSPEKAAVLKMKAEMHAALLRKAKKYTQKELQGILKEPQPRVSSMQVPPPA